MESQISKGDAAPGSTPVLYAGVSMNQAGLSELNGYLTASDAIDMWEMLLLAGSLGARVDAALKSQEPAFVAKYCFELAQAFNNFYHKHHILSEADQKRKAFLLLLSKIVGIQLGSALGLLGISAPTRM